jgi:hypothetical protein
VAKILLHLPHIAISYTRFGATPIPDTQLFVLQRVSRTFQATILDTKTLRQRMFLALTPEPQPSNWVHLYHSGMTDWLLREIGVSNERKELCRRIHGLGISDTRALRPQDKRPEASWRKINLHCLERGNAINVRLVCIDNACVLLRCFGCKEDMTLGQLHDALQRLIPCISAHYCAVYSVYLYQKPFGGAFGSEENRESNARNWEAMQHAWDTRRKLIAECARDDAWR